MHRTYFSAWKFLGLLAATLSSPGLEAQDPVLTEVVERNVKSLIDEDGDSPDWIEIYNPGTSPLSLEGWSLTDDTKDLAKWVFPASTVPARGFLIVHASGKDRRKAGGPLHTNFKIGDGREFLGLVAPGGTRVASRIGPGYPKQVEDVSYGSPFVLESTVLFAEGSAARTHVPTDDTLLGTWIEPSFDDSSWLEGLTGVGYDRKTVRTYADLIATDIQTQMSTVNSSFYLRVPFSSGEPSAYDVLLLRMKYDDGFVAYLNGVEVARRNAPTALPWNARATTRHLEAAAVLWEDINISEHLGLLQAGTNVLAIRALNLTRTDQDVLIVPRLEAAKVLDVETNTRVYFPVPTPGWANGPGLPGVAEDPRFSHEAGGHVAPFDLVLSVLSPTAVIRYTLDRTMPSESSTAYEGPLAISTTAVVRARVFDEGLVPSGVVTRVFFSVHSSLESWSSNLPLMVAANFGRGFGSSTYTPVYFGTIEPDGGSRTHLLLDHSYTGTGGMRWRGSSSLGFAKKNFNLEVYDDYGREEDVPFFSMPDGSDWVLHGPYSDKTLMRNYLAYAFSNQIGRYAVRTRFIELFISSSTAGNIVQSDYQGVYVAMERIKRGPDRVPVRPVYASETQEPEVSGGYILKIDRLGPGEIGFTTARGRPLVYVYPKEPVVTAAQKAYLLSFFNQFETALYGTKYTDPEVGYAKYIDPDSFIDHHILTELCKNIDGYRLSTYLYKDRQGKLTIGPLWDFNLSLGNANYLGGWQPEGWYYTQVSGNDYSWYPRLFQDPEFTRRYRERWFALRQGPFGMKTLLGQIDAAAAYLEEAQARNFKKWPTLGTYVWPNQFIGKTYAEEIGFMRGWLEDRLVWIDSQFLKVPVFNQNGGAIASGFELVITAPEGSVYYTLDGSDPRAEGDDLPSSSAFLYAGPVVLSANTKVTARARAGGGWSAAKTASFVVSVPPIVVTELLARPADPPEGSPFRRDQFEFVELLNVGDVAIDLDGLRFTTGINFDFTTGTVDRLEPGEYVVLVASLEAFASRYDVSGIKIAGEYTRNLSDTRASLTLLGAIDETIQKFTYQTAWYPVTNLDGHSLVIRDPRAPLDSWGLEESWRESSAIGGSPGGPDPDLPPTDGLQRPGDLSQDGRLSVSDAVILLLHLFAGQEIALPCGGTSIEDGGNKALADFNGDLAVNASDAVAVLNYLFQKGPPPAVGEGCVRLEGCPDVCTSP